MQIKTDDGEKAYYNVEHVNETVFYEEVVTPDINHQFEYVDLGLPSGTLWATCNVGAMNPEYGGDCFAWGETEHKSNFEWSNYKWAIANDESSYSLTKYGKNDQQTTLLPEDDAATVNWGADWRMPTKEEIQELIDNCTGVDSDGGIRFTGPNGNSVFFPHTTNGFSHTFIWSSSGFGDFAYYLNLQNWLNRAGGDWYPYLESGIGNEERRCGKYVRPVRSTPLH